VPCTALVKQIKQRQPCMPVIIAGTLGHGHCPGADHSLETFDPNQLLKLLQELEPEKTAEILQRDAKLSAP
jgi:hypothetical protein